MDVNFDMNALAALNAQKQKKETAPPLNDLEGKLNLLSKNMGKFTTTETMKITTATLEMLEKIAELDNIADTLKEKYNLK